MRLGKWTLHILCCLTIFTGHSFSQTQREQAIELIKKDPVLQNQLKEEFVAQAKDTVDTSLLFTPPPLRSLLIA